MGRQYGGLMKTELNDEYTLLINTMDRKRYTKEMLRDLAQEEMNKYPARQQEVFAGMAETSGLTKDDILILYDGLMIVLTSAESPASCSFMAAWGNYTADGSVVASRNWDLSDSLIVPFNKWYVLTVYRPSDGSNGVVTVGPAGMRPETSMNEKGLLIANDNSGIFTDEAPDLRPDFVSEFFRFMLDSSDLGGLMIAINGTRPNCPWIIDVAGPEGAYVFEMMTNNTRLRTGDGVVAAANHFIDPAWNLPPPPGHSSSRYNNLLMQADAAKGSIDAEKMMEIRNVSWENGGATFLHTALSSNHPEELTSTDHQVVFVPKTRTLWMKVMEKDWQKIELAPLFEG